MTMFPTRERCPNKAAVSPTRPIAAGPHEGFQEKS
jgi:hypothetical protein